MLSADASVSAAEMFNSKSLKYSFVTGGHMGGFCFKAPPENQLIVNFVLSYSGVVFRYILFLTISQKLTNS